MASVCEKTPKRTSIRFRLAARPLPLNTEVKKQLHKISIATDAAHEGMLHIPCY